jgi:deazaflavin-dependent oxidoreductase (nitroreductase family)
MKRVLCVSTLALLAAGVVFVMGLRHKSPTVLGAIRRMNRSVFNPHQMKSAGQPGSYASIIRHRGRTTDQAYETPIQAIRTDDGFLIGLPYGSQSDWLQNVVAAGSASLVHEGETHSVDQPELIDMESAAEYFSPEEQRTHRLFGVDQALRLRRAAIEAPA